MASGDPVLKLLRAFPPGASFAPQALITGASSPAENFVVYQFADAAAAYIDFLVALEGYDGGGLTLRLGWSAAVATNNAVWQAAFRRIEDDAEDMDTTAHTYDYNTVTAAAPSAIGELSYDEITFSNGADMDSFAERETAILRILRDPANGSDNLGNTAYLWSVWGRET